jgi:hypothetical protein
MEDHHAILAVLADYFTGLYTGDTALLRSVFHPEAALFAEVAGQSYHKRLDEYLAGVEKRQSPEELGEPYQMKVLSVDVTHGIATARACGSSSTRYFSTCPYGRKRSRYEC